MTEDDGEVLEHPGLRRRSTWLLAAAGAVLLGLGVVAAVRHVGGHSAPPTPTAAQCVVPLPHQWSKRIRAGLVASADSSQRNEGGLLPLGVSTDGLTLATGVSHERARLVVIRPDHSLRRIANPADTVAKQGYLPIGQPAAVSGNWVVFSREQTGGADRPASALFAANTATRDVRRLSPRWLERSEYSLGAPILAGGTVYFSATDTAQGLGVGPGYVYAYDLARDRRSVVDRGDVGRVTGAGGGVSWRRGSLTVAHRSHSLPPGYETGGSSLVADGDRQAWLQRVAGSAAQLRIRTGTGRAVVVVRRLGHAPDLSALSGPFVAYDDGDHATVLDTRTGAQTRLGSYFLAIDAGGGTLALARISSRGYETSIVRVADLPELHC